MICEEEWLRECNDTGDDTKDEGANGNEAGDEDEDENEKG